MWLLWALPSKWRDCQDPFCQERSQKTFKMAKRDSWLSFQWKSGYCPRDPPRIVWFFEAESLIIFGWSILQPCRDRNSAFKSLVINFTELLQQAGNLLDPSNAKIDEIHFQSVPRLEEEAHTLIDTESSFTCAPVITLILKSTQK